MEISDLSIKIKFQKASYTSDSSGNRTATWTDYYTCRAQGGDELSFIGAERDIAGQILDYSRISFTVRACTTLSDLNSLEYRVVFDSEIYNILRIKHFDFKNRQIKIFCQRARR